MARLRAVAGPLLPPRLQSPLVEICQQPHGRFPRPPDLIFHYISLKRHPHPRRQLRPAVVCFRRHLRLRLATAEAAFPMHLACMEMLTLPIPLA